MGQLVGLLRVQAQGLFAQHMPAVFQQEFDHFIMKPRRGADVDRADGRVQQRRRVRGPLGNPPLLREGPCPRLAVAHDRADGDADGPQGHGVGLRDASGAPDGCLMLIHGGVPPFYAFDVSKKLAEGELFQRTRKRHISIMIGKIMGLRLILSKM